MKERPDMHSRDELVRMNYKAYQKAGKKEKGDILNRLEMDTGLNRDYLATKLAGYKEAVTVVVTGSNEMVRLKASRKRKQRDKGKRGGRPPVYTKEFVDVLTAIWDFYGRQCGTLLSAQIRLTIDNLAASGSSLSPETPDFKITSEMRKLLITISGSHINRLLAPVKKSLRVSGKSLTAPGQILRNQVPIRTFFSWDQMKPGFFENDRVAHCGNSTAGHFCWTLTSTDVYSGWVEERALLNNAHRWVKEAMSNIKSELPFPLKGIDTDNGGEFINTQLVAWCAENTVQFTRGRPYRKNDNCFVEQKNGDVVRKEVGYFRYDTPAEFEAIEEVYLALNPLRNYFTPGIKLIGKVKQEDGRYKKIYDKPETPCERLLVSPDLAEEYKAELRRRRCLYNPVLLRQKVNEAVQRLLKINAEKVKIQQPLVEGDESAALPKAEGQAA